MTMKEDDEGDGEAAESIDLGEVATGGGFTLKRGEDFGGPAHVLAAFFGGSFCSFFGG